MKTKTLKLKPHLGWANAQEWQERDFMIGSRKVSPDDVRIAVIPLDDVDGLLTRFCEATHDSSAITYRDSMRDALTAIGVLPKRKNGGRK